MAERIKVRRLSDEEGQRLLWIVRRGRPNSVSYRRAMIVLASASGNAVPAIARLVQANEEAVREVIHDFNEIGLACLDPHRAGGRPRRITDEDRARDDGPRHAAHPSQRRIAPATRPEWLRATYKRTHGIARWGFRRRRKRLAAYRLLRARAPSRASQSRHRRSPRGWFR